MQNTKYFCNLFQIQITVYVFQVYDTGRLREVQIVYNTGRHRASNAQFLTPHTVGGGQASLLHPSNGLPRIIDFSFFDLGAYPSAKVTKMGDNLLPN